MIRFISLTLAFLITANFAHASSWLESKEVFPKGAPNHDVVCDDLTKITDRKARAYVLNVAHALASAIPGAPRYNYREVWANDGYFNLLKQIIPHVCRLAVVSVTNDNFDRNCQAMYKDTRDSINWHTGKIEIAGYPFPEYLQYVAAYVIGSQLPGTSLPPNTSRDKNWLKLKTALGQVEPRRLPFLTRALIEMAQIDPAFEYVDGLAPSRSDFVVSLSQCRRMCMNSPKRFINIEILSSLGRNLMRMGSLNSSISPYCRYLGYRLSRMEP